MLIFNRIKEFFKKFIPQRFLDLYHFSLAFLGAFFYCWPSKKIKVIGVTGTNGKTTVTEMICKILEEGGFKVALLNSIRFKVGEKERKNDLRMTMPGRFAPQKLLREAVNSRCQYAILEVTSEGIKQHRHRFINFSVAVFNNLTPEHIEAHGSFEQYRAAKGKLFESCKGLHIINKDDENAEYFLKFPSVKKITYGLEDKNNLISGVKLLGDFNIYNAIAAVQLGLSQGVDLKTCQKAIEKIELMPGRMECIVDHNFKVFVDYAFTPNALEQVYKTLTAKLEKEDSKLICVLGACGGGRDKWKRPILGEIAYRYCHNIILTNEDPYDENPMEIIKQVALGAKGKAEIVFDRMEAIRKSLKLAKEGDIVIITGKGSESSICLAGGKKMPWDDRRAVREAFQKFSFSEIKR